jgi:hypothetical protein
LVEHDLAKVGVAGSSPVFRSSLKEKGDEKSIPMCLEVRFFSQKEILIIGVADVAQW